MATEANWRDLYQAKRDSGYRTQLQIKENVQCKDTGPPDQIQLIHSKCNMKKLFHCNCKIPLWVGIG
jgi:hypothetical protein